MMAHNTDNELYFYWLGDGVRPLSQPEASVILSQYEPLLQTLEATPLPLPMPPSQAVPNYMVCYMIMMM